MDPRITALQSTSFSGRLADLLPNESRNELCKVICGNLDRVSAKGDHRVGACMWMPGHLERQGIPRLQEKLQNMVRAISSKPVWNSTSDPGLPIAAPLRDLRPRCPEVDPDTKRGASCETPMWTGTIVSGTAAMPETMTCRPCAPT